MEIEHKTPLSRGGMNEDNNVVASCSACNREKGTKTEREYREFLELIEEVTYQMVST
jgi:5-methylcytosine-specific restriction endonuclease McrA